MVSTSPRLQLAMPPVRSQSPAKARTEAPHCTAVGGLSKKTNRNSGTKITKSPVIKPELAALVYFRPTVWVRYKVARIDANIADSLSKASLFFFVSTHGRSRAEESRKR